MNNIANVGSLRFVNSTNIPGTPYSRPNILDTVGSAKFAYSFSLLRAAYAGASVSVRNSNNTLADIGFTATGSFDTVAYNLHVNLGDGTGHVAKWYDQSGGGNDLIQGTNGNQPTITLSGQNNKPGVRFVAANSQLMDTVDFGAGMTVSSVSMIASYDGTYNDNAAGVFVSHKTSGKWQFYKRGNNRFALFQGGTAIDTPEGDNTLPNIFMGTFNGATSNGSNLRINGGNTLTGTMAAVTIPGLRVGADSVPNYLTGTITELIGYGSILSAGDQNSIGQNQSTWYKIPYLTAVNSTSILTVAGQDDYCPVLEVLPNGNWVSVYVTGPHGRPNIAQDAVLHIRFSSDKGATWTAEDKYLDGSSVTGFPMNPPGMTGNIGTGEPYFCICPNGDFLVLSYLTDFSTNKTHSLGSFQARCTDGLGKVWETVMTAITYQNFPGGYAVNQNYIFNTDDAFNVGTDMYSAIRMMITTGANEGNSSGTGTFKKMFVKSPDNGVTWNYLSDMSTFTSAVGGANGTIECGLTYRGGTTIRSVHRGQIGDYNSYQTDSNDMGATWNGGTQTAPGALTVVTGKNLHTGRPRIRSFARLFGQATWWDDTRLVMNGLSGDDNNRRPCIWVSYDGGDNWCYPMFVDVANGNLNQSYGMVLYDSVNKELVQHANVFTGAVDQVKQYRLNVFGLNGS